MTRAGGGSRSRVLRALLLGVGVVAILGLGLSAVLFSRWNEVRTVSPEEAERAFAEALVETGGGPPYLEVGADGGVRVRRELEGAERATLRSLCLLAWKPDAGRLIEIRFPYWFVRMKLTDTLNLGTLTAALSQDWANLDLRVSEQDLERLGPALVLDQGRQDGARIMLWTR